MIPKYPVNIVFEKLTLEQAEERFPGSVDEDTRELWASNEGEKDYYQLGVYNGQLYGSTYEIGWNGWSVWDTNTKSWRDLDEYNTDLFDRLECLGDYDGCELTFEFK